MRITRKRLVTNEKRGGMTGVNYHCRAERTNRSLRIDKPWLKRAQRAIQTGQGSASPLLLLLLLVPRSSFLIPRKVTEAC